MRKLLLVTFATSLVLFSCSDGIKDKSVSDLIEYNRTHTDHADSADIAYAIAHNITPDSAVAIRKAGKK
jgi:hypothetical protein